MDDTLNLFEDDDEGVSSVGSVENITHTYEDGYKDGIKDFADQCEKYTDCTDCPINAMLGDGITCAQFRSKFPDRASSMIKQMKASGHTYFEEFLLRMPDFQGTVENLAYLNLCRKAIFESYYNCTRVSANMTDDQRTQVCLKCWQEQYSGDKTEEE